MRDLAHSVAEGIEVERLPEYAIKSGPL